MDCHHVHNTKVFCRVFSESRDMNMRVLWIVICLLLFVISCGEDPGTSNSSQKTLPQQVNHIQNQKMEENSSSQKAKKETKETIEKNTSLKKTEALTKKTSEKISEKISEKTQEKTSEKTSEPVTEEVNAENYKTEQGKSIDNLSLTRPLRLQFIYDTPAHTPATPKVTLYQKDQSMEWRQPLRLGDYTLVVEQEGYEAWTNDFILETGKQDFVLEVLLEASSRKLVFSIWEKSPDKTITPDEILINGKVYRENQLITPGEHVFQVFKTGYLPQEEKVTVLASRAPFVFSRQTQALPRLVTISFVKENGISVSPSGVKWNNYHWDNKQVLEITPGEYTLEVDNAQYEKLKQTILVQPGEGVKEVEVTLQSKTSPKCLVSLKAMSPFPGPGTYQVSPELVTLNKTSLKAEHPFASGTYELIVEIPGYPRIQENVKVPLGKSHLIIEKTIIPSPRQVIFEIISQGKQVEPEKILVNGKKFTGTLIPGKHFLRIEKPGYTKISEEIFVDLDINKKPFSLTRQMQVLPVEINFVFQDTQGQAVSPEAIKWENQSWDKTPLHVLPGQYSIEIKHSGYEDFQQEIKVQPGEETQNIKIQLQKKQVEEKTIDQTIREIELLVVSDSKPEVFIQPAIMTLNDQSYTPGISKEVGEYALVVWESGHAMYTHQLVIEPSKDKFTFTATLQSPPRKVNVTFDYDIPPAPDYPTCEVKISSTKTEEAQTLHDGIMIKPAEYIIEATQVGYEYTGNKVIFIAPQSDPFELKIPMRIKKAKAKTNSSSTPSESSKNIELTPEKTTKASSKIDKCVLVIVAVDPKTKEKIKPTQLLVDGKPYLDEWIPIGTSVQLEVLFKNYASYRESIVVKSLEEVHEIYVPLSPLKVMVFTSSSSDTPLDEIFYPYSFELDGKVIEDHLIKKESKENLFYYTLWVPETAKEILIYSGYRFNDKDLIRNHQNIGYLSQIDAYRLTTHLDKVREKLGNAKALSTIESLLGRYLIKWRGSWDSDKKIHLLNYLFQWEVKEMDLLPRKDRILNKIEVLGE